MKESENSGESQEGLNKTLLMFFGVMSLIFLGMSLYFLSGITGNAIGESRTTFSNMAVFILVFFVVAIIETYLIFLSRSRKKKEDINRLIKESGEFGNFLFRR